MTSKYKTGDLVEVRSPVDNIYCKGLVIKVDDYPDNPPNGPRYFYEVLIKEEIFCFDEYSLNIYAWTVKTANEAQEYIRKRKEEGTWFPSIK